MQIVRRGDPGGGAQEDHGGRGDGNFFLDLANLPGSRRGVNCKVLPVQLPRVIGVSAVGFTQKLAFYSNYGFGAVDLTAPGGDGLIPNPLVTDTTASGQVLRPDPGEQPLLPGRGRLRRPGAGLLDSRAARRTPTCRGRRRPRRTSTGVAALAISRFGKMTPERCWSKLSLAATPLACPPSPYDPLPVGQPATCKGPAFYNNFYGAGEVDALATIR